MTDKKKDKTNFEVLREIDVSKYVEKKGKFNYLSWVWAVDQMYLSDPKAKYEFPEREVFNDGTIMVYCLVTMFGEERKGFLPVLNYQNKPVANPNAFEINTAMQRCLVKTIALHGLGLYIYAGEDLPDGKEPEVVGEKVKIIKNPVEGEEYQALIGGIQNAKTMDEFNTAKDKVKAAWGRINKAQGGAITSAVEKKDKELDDIPT